ncbi:MAG TPA: hypothetical protein VGC56_17925 [Allosphingosinicella sp.]|jgi:hypothetical protein
MAKVVITKMAGKTARAIGAKSTGVVLKRVSKDGRITSVRTLDADSETFGKDFTWTFGANVKKAREENKRIIGAPDRGPAEG